MLSAESVTAWHYLLGRMISIASESRVFESWIVVEYQWEYITHMMAMKRNNGVRQDSVDGVRHYLKLTFSTTNSLLIWLIIDPSESDVIENRIVELRQWWEYIIRKHGKLKGKTAWSMERDGVRHERDRIRRCWHHSYLTVLYQILMNLEICWSLGGWHWFYLIISSWTYNWYN